MWLVCVIGGEKIPIFGVLSVLCVKRTIKTDPARENSQNWLFSGINGLTGSFRSRAGSRPTGVHREQRTRAMPCVARGEAAEQALERGVGACGWRHAAAPHWVRLPRALSAWGRGAALVQGIVGTATWRGPVGPALCDTARVDAGGRGCGHVAASDWSRGGVGARGAHCSLPEGISGARILAFWAI